MQKTPIKTFTLKDFYKDYKVSHPHNSSLYITEKQYREINEDFFQLILFFMISTGEAFTLPYRLGILKIRKRRLLEDDRRLDYKLSKQYKKSIYHVNNHSNGYYARFKWDKSKIYLRNKNLYKFKACRWATRLLAKYIIKHNSIIKYYG